MRSSSLSWIYGLVSVVAAVAVFAAHGRSAVFNSAAWLRWPETIAHIASLAFGLVLGLAGAALTRSLVSWSRWAALLHRELRPFALSLSAQDLLRLSLLSAVGEELLFRGLLQPWSGLLAQSLIFGILHQTRGPARWVWAAWATLAGLILGALFAATGSLVGCIVAHALINFLNLSYLRARDPAAQMRALDGLLSQRS